jgi:polar amino acid transport system substrate-binding protein
MMTSQPTLRQPRRAAVARALLTLTGAVIAILALSFGVSSARAQGARLRVAIKPIAPFVMQREDKTVGFSIDYWQQVARRLNRDYDFVMLDSVSAVLDAVKNGDADVGIAAISMTAEREKAVDFTHGYFDAGLQIMVHTVPNSVLNSVIATLFSRDMLQLMLIIAGITFVFTHIIWLVERRTNPKYPQGYRAGISAALWWTVVTLATVGDSEGTPKHRIGKLLAILWMFISIILIANFTAVVTSSATLRDLRGSIQGVGDLPGKTIATVKNTTAARFLSDNGYAFTAVDKIDDAYALLNAEKVQAIVFDAPVLRYYAVTTGRGYAEVVGGPFEQEQYGIVVPQGSPLREEIDRLILDFQKDGTVRSITAKWFGDK